MTPHKHFRRKELQEVPRGQSHSFPILAPFRTAHCSPASHCKQHNVWSWHMHKSRHPKATPPVNTGSASWERRMDPITLTGGLSIVRPKMEESFVLIISVREHKKKFKLLSPSYILPLCGGGGGLRNGGGESWITFPGSFSCLSRRLKKKSTRPFF